MTTTPSRSGGTIRVRCPHCLRDTHAPWWLPSGRYKFRYSHDQPHWSRQRYGDIYANDTSALQCDTTSCPENGCRGPITLVLFWRADPDELAKDLKSDWHITPGDTRLVELLEVLPSGGLAKMTLDALPEKVRAEFPAVVELAARGEAPALAASGCGACLEEALKDLERRALSESWMNAPLSPKTRLVERIDALVAASVLTRDLGEWSHEVRLLRNDGTHELTASIDDVRELVAFMKFFFEEAFALPARLKRLKADVTPKP